MDQSAWEKWYPLLNSLYDGERYTGRQLPGSCITEWLEYIQHDWDAVDALYLDHEVIGG